MGDAMKKIVFCEGKDDVAVVRGLTTHLGLDIEVESYDGKNKLPLLLQSLPKRPDFAQQKVAAIAILRDADADSNATFTSVRDTLKQNNFEAPAAADGTFSESALKVGVFIVGVNGRGMIEDLCLQSVSDQPEFSCVDSYFACIAQKSSRSNFPSKGKVRVWMASHEDFEFYVGKAAEEGYWPWASPAFDPLKNFLQAL
jgi:hypothetical protein